MKKTINNPIIRDSVHFIQTSAESGGTVSEMEVKLAPGSGTLLHFHYAYTEIFTAIEGMLYLKLKGKKPILLKEGATYSIKPMLVHKFYNPNPYRIKFNVKLKPGHTGFENSLRISYGLATDGLTNRIGIPKRLQNTAIITHMGDVNLPGICSLFNPILNKIAEKAKRSGEEQKLIEKYCL